VVISFQRRFWILLLAGIAGVGCWWALTKTDAERVVFRAVIRGFANPPFFVTGNGSHETPWTLRTLATVPKIDSGKAPVVVSIGDDPDGVFESSPPSPTDFAVVLKNLQRLGAKNAAIAAVLAWEKPEPMDLKGLELVLDDFDMVIHAAPLSRGTVRQAMPPAFRAAALRPTAIQGDLAGLPIVNRVAIPDVIFGGEGALAGFSTLDDADSGSGKTPMLARWEEDDRVVLAFPLLAVLARFDLPVDGIRVRLGEFLELGPKGPVIPIDRNGCLALPPKPVPFRADVSAESLIDGEPEIFPAAPGLIVLVDEQSTTSLATRRFSEELGSAIASISSDAGLGPPSSYPRLAPEWERIMIAVVALGLAWWLGMPRFTRQVGLGVMLALCVAAPWLGVGLAQLWLPGLPLAAAIVAAGWLALLLDGSPVPVSPHEGVRPPAKPVAGTPTRTALRPASHRTMAIWREPTMRQPETRSAWGGGDLPQVVLVEESDESDLSDLSDTSDLSDSSDVAPVAEREAEQPPALDPSARKSGRKKKRRSQRS
jgi:hypothetical protein